MLLISMRFFVFFVFFVTGAYAYAVCALASAFEVGYISSEQFANSKTSPRHNFNVQDFIIYDITKSTMAFNDSVTDSDCIKAAQESERLDHELDELVKALTEMDESATTTPTSTTSGSQPSTYRNVQFDALTAWLDGLADTTLPSFNDTANPEVPSNFTNLLTKPVEQSWLDERAMNSFDYAAARAQWGGSHPSSAITISSDGSSASPITISSDGTSALHSERAVGHLSSPVLAPASQPAALSTSSFKTPERPTMPASTQAPKKKRRYSKWSMSRLQCEYLQRFMPISQKRTLDRQFMIDALTFNDMEKSSKTSTSSTSSTKKRRNI
jgi:hypothetical protein